MENKELSKSVRAVKRIIIAETVCYNPKDASRFIKELDNQLSNGDYREFIGCIDLMLDVLTQAKKDLEGE